MTRGQCGSLLLHRKGLAPSVSRRSPDAPSRYLQQLCKHWSHNLAVEVDEAKGTVVFPRNARGADWPADATLKLVAHQSALDCGLEASSAGQLEALKGAVARHLDRFAFREAPLAFDWRDAASSP